MASWMLFASVAKPMQGNKTLQPFEEKRTLATLIMFISLDQAMAKAIVAKLQSPGNQTQRVSASNVAVRATNGDFFQPKMLPATTATKRYIISLSVAARSATQTRYMK